MMFSLLIDRPQPAPVHFPAIELMRQKWRAGPVRITNTLGGAPQLSGPGDWTNVKASDRAVFTKIVDLNQKKAVFWHIRL